MYAQDYLSHYGVNGMHWGQRKALDRNERHTSNLAKKDVKRYADAKMFYGKTAGTRRKLLKAELEKKKAQIPGYEEAFNKHLENVDYAKSAKKAVIERKTKDAAYRTRVTVKQILGVTGTLTAAAAAAGVIYSRNKPAIDNFIASKASMVFDALKNAVGR